MTLEEALTELLKRVSPVPMALVTGTVVSVDVATATCTVQPLSDDRALLDDVRLRAAANDLPSADVQTGGELRLPKEGSVVVVAMVDGEADSAVVLVTTQLTRWELNAEVILNSGAHGGLVRIDPLVQKINLLEQRVNELQQALYTHTHNVTAVGSPTGPAVPNAPGNPLQLTQRTDLENNRVKH